ncbi:hypothetical protein [Streptomyces sp. NBC_00648]|uniref:hypothetical protein n=1 Tax=Streptomyces sp. NBC_00648 TaxID=2975797 RepID=UPI0032536D8A
MPATRTLTSRRAALAATGAAAAAGLLAACSDSTAPDADRGAAEQARAARAEAALRLRTSAASTALRDRYQAVSVRHPLVRDRLAPLREEAAQHATALAAGHAQQPSAPSSTLPAAVPDDPSEALRELAATARQVSDTHTAALTGAPPELARLLASVAAAGAVHAYLLTRREGGS